MDEEGPDQRANDADTDRDEARPLHERVGKHRRPENLRQEIHAGTNHGVEEPLDSARGAEPQRRQFGE
jgi:hypothetical protein